MTSNETSGEVLLPVRIAGTGSYVPEKILTNHDLEKMVDTSDDWITSRTGIKERRIAAEDEYTSTWPPMQARTLWIKLASAVKILS